MFRAFSVTWTRGSARRKPFSSVSCKGIPIKGQHWLSQNCPNQGRPHHPRMSAVSLSTGVPSLEDPAVVGAWRTSG